MNPITTLNSLSNVRRGWPHRDSIIFEQFDSDGHLRAGRITDQVEYTPFATDKKLPTLTGDGTLLVHRFHKRAVVDHGEAITKHVRAGKAAAIASASTQFHALCAPIGIGAAKVTGQTDSSVTFAKLPGRTLHDNPTPQAWEAFFSLWPHLTRQKADLPTFDADKEATTLAQWVRVTATFRAHSQITAISTAAQKVMYDLEAKPDEHVLLHRDLHDKQLLWDGSTLSVLDVDTAAYGEAALDVGNLLAHIHLRRVQRVLTAAEADTIISGILTMAEELHITQPRLNTYVRSALLRLCCVYSFRPTAAAWLDEFIHYALEGSHSL